VRITKRSWRKFGGLRNSRNYRVQRGGRWYYYNSEGGIDEQYRLFMAVLKHGGAEGGQDDRAKTD
jgi:hypothetical protein